MYSILACTRQVSFYKVGAKHGHVYLIRLYITKTSINALLWTIDQIEKIIYKQVYTTNNKKKNVFYKYVYLYNVYLGRY